MNLNTFIDQLLNELDVDRQVLSQELKIDSEYLVDCLADLFNAHKKLVATSTYVVPLGCTLLTPLLKGFFSHLNKNILNNWYNKEKYILNKPTPILHTKQEENSKREYDLVFISSDQSDMNIDSQNRSRAKQEQKKKEINKIQEKIELKKKLFDRNPEPIYYSTQPSQQPSLERNQDRNKNMMNKMMNSMVNTMNVMNLMNTIKNANVPNQIVNKINPNSNVPVVKTNQSNPDTEDRFSRIESLMKAFQQNTLTSNVKGRKSTIRKFMKQIDFDGVKIENKLLTSKLEEDNEERDDEEIYSILKEVKCQDYNDFGMKLRDYEEFDNERFLHYWKYDDENLKQQLVESIRNMEMSHRVLKDHLYGACLKKGQIEEWQGFNELCKQIMYHKRNSLKGKFAQNEMEEMVRLISVGISIEGYGFLNLLKE